MIYLLGNNALTFYLAAKLQDSGKDFRIMAGRKENIDIETNGITLKEEHTLSKKRYKFKTAFLIKDQPELVIISCDAHQINRHLTLLSPQALRSVPVLFFPPLPDIAYIENLLNPDLIHAYFNGYLTQKNNIVSLSGPAPDIRLGGNLKKPGINRLLQTLNDTKLTLSVTEDENLAFWEYFIPYAAGSLFTAYHEQTLTQLNRRPENKEKLKALVNELADLAAKDLVLVPRENILVQLFSTPSAYNYPLFDSLKTHAQTDVALVCGTLAERIRAKPADYPLLRQILKKLYGAFV